MSERGGFLKVVTARVRALLPQHWRGEVGQRWRGVIRAISEYSENDIRIAERVREAPDVLWNTAKKNSAEALLKAADEENTRIASELARQTLADKARQEKGTADKIEIEARILRIKEVEAQVTLVEKLRSVNTIPIWDAKGNLRFIKAPESFDWDGLASHLLSAGDLTLPGGSNVNLIGSSQGRSTASGGGINLIQGAGGIPSEESFGTPDIQSDELNPKKAI